MVATAVPNLPDLLTTRDHIRELARVLQQAKIVAFDTEFIRESTFFPTLEIIQIATREQVWLVDARAFLAQGTDAAREALRPLIEILESPDILKVAHAIQGDQECLYSSLKVLAKPTLDTAVAASLCGYGDGIGLGNLLKAALNVSIKKGHARTNWAARPLPPQLLEYARADVEHLVGLAEHLLGELEQMNRKEWAFELSSKWEDPTLYEPDPEGLATRIAKGRRMDKKAYAALIELMKWREARIRQLNLPRRWVADDHVLMDLAQVRPKTLEHLSAFRGLNKGELKQSGKAILDAITRSAEAQDLKAPRAPKPEMPTAEESQVLDLLKCYLGILADQHKIALKHLVTSPQLISLLRNRSASTSEMVEKEILSQGAAKLIGEEVAAFLNGKRALSVKDGRIEIVATPEK